MFSYIASKRYSHRRSRGFNLVELAIVAGVAGLLLGGIWWIAALVNGNAKKELAIQQLAVIINNMRSTYQGLPGIDRATGGYDQLTPCLIARKVIPRDLMRRPDLFSSATCSATLNADIAVDHVWGQRTPDGTLLTKGGIKIGENDQTTATGYDQYFRVRYEALPTDACVAFVVKASQGGLIKGLNSLRIDSTSFTSLPITGKQAHDSCKMAGAGAGAAVEFVVKLRN
jgi:PilS N terminal